LRPMHNGGYLVGPALTMKCRPGDNLMIHKAIGPSQLGQRVGGSELPGRPSEAIADFTRGIKGELWDSLTLIDPLRLLGLLRA
ncbi:MAG: methyltransferase, partial [Ramlibacter sp.]|nr:methyltransferase [Ramlibacter sp.]